jgi:hypothetical protein
MVAYYWNLHIYGLKHAIANLSLELLCMSINYPLKIHTYNCPILTYNITRRKISPINGHEPARGKTPLCDAMP